MLIDLLIITAGVVAGILFLAEVVIQNAVELASYAILLYIFLFHSEGIIKNRQQYCYYVFLPVFTPVEKRGRYPFIVFC